MATEKLDKPLTYEEERGKPMPNTGPECFPATKFGFEA
jgi:hypothetical protein